MNELTTGSGDVASLSMWTLIWNMEGGGGLFRGLWGGGGPQKGAPVRILLGAPVKGNPGRRQLYIVTSIFIPGFLLLDPEVFP